MATPDWQLTREMFLSAEEVENLLYGLRSRLASMQGGMQEVARLEQLLIEGLLFSGLRNSEFCRLKLADTSLAHGKSALEVRHAKKDNRTVYLPTHVNDLIERYISQTRPRFLPETIDPHDLEQPLLFHERKRAFDRTTLYRRVVRILSQFGLEDRASVQLLRHTYGFLAYQRSGGNLLFVQRQLGHAHPMITSVYAQFVEESYAQLAERVFLSK
ncbi:Tyrosine recombinase XerD [Planctomycetales bacterium 10988]|nr:Tyrosine recombinase XerD [Planctomycetales bacterium 10988]